MNRKYNRRIVRWIAAVMLLILVFAGIGLLSGPRPSAPGEVYEFDGLLYLSPLSSSTFDYAESRLKSARVTAKGELFRIDYPGEDVYELPLPNYAKEEMTPDMAKTFEKSTFGTVSVSRFKEKYRYSIYAGDGRKIHFHLFVMDDQVWLSSFADNTADKSEITMELWKLKRLSQSGISEERTPPYEQLARNILETMSTEEKVGQMFLLRCRKDSAVADIEACSPGGYILFAGDIEGNTRETLKSAIQSYQAASRLGLLIGIDEEGGDVIRVSKYPEFRPEPFRSPQSLYAEGGYELVAADAKEKAELLKSLGFNLNLAPVCDVSTNPADYIFPRTLGRGAEDTAEYVKTVVEAMNTSGIGCTLKHFPGYGSNPDTHKGIAVDNRSYDAFVGSDFVPFQAGIEAGAGSVLVSHNMVRCMDESLPASLSPAVHEILRKVLGFDGVIMTDDLSMDAVKENFGDGESAVMAVLAGNDLILASDFDVQISTVLAAVESGSITEERIDESVIRILVWKLRLGIIS